MRAEGNDSTVVLPVVQSMYIRELSEENFLTKYTLKYLMITGSVWEHAYTPSVIMHISIAAGEMG